MSWGDFYLICFLLGVGISVFSWLAGSVNFHLPHIHMIHFRMIHFRGIRFGGHGNAARGASHAHGPGFFNIGTIAAFLAWFGGTGYLLREYHVAGFVFALLAALLAGFAGAALVFWFLAKFLMRGDETLDPADYDMIGVLGRISSPILAGTSSTQGAVSGTGEMVFSQMGARRSAAVRSESGAEIPKGTEVVVTRCERGIAYVRVWEELSGIPASHLENEKSANEKEKA